MEKINTALISSVRKLRCAYRILFEHDPQSPARIVLEGPSIETVGSRFFYPPDIALLFLDYRIVYKDSGLFFALTRTYFPSIPIILLVDNQQFSPSQHCRDSVSALFSVDSDPSTLFSLIRDMAYFPPLIQIT
ncbi:hypothetical protein [Sphingobacterium puteale]|uniref:hypothetical protein n=1 Tax=Sphingobacterium puteale TaxID=2420510 RepID=UPI003D99955C